ncbi:MAG TPA: HU family DNA-binding protein [Deltaproteobacteria bacterium]|nr:HU family DNA-binding protein [Deltaproteobacteria bacterium]HRW81496.1 HU family DNA-binding protein [Desulfomonilia bacterium]NMD39838.1 HU family DNA-binding protein [Deltaproteobacteria bacterium]HNQ86583.1 HU family DNA-binding protein [Deltaproteobacteria bacterium]HNS90689.1 HU family DNA-binding protein [Deltaproteobacteria bacterium]
MTKMDLVDVVAGKQKISKAAALAVVDALTDAIAGALKKGDKVTLVGFGSFDVAKRAARMGVNPRTRQKIKIKASKAPRFRAGKALKDAVNK